MKNHLTLALALLLGPATTLASAQDGATERRAKAPRYDIASQLIGQDLRSRKDAAGEQVDLGDVRDFIVDSESGSVTHLIVASGGLGSVGGTLRRVPYSSLRFEHDLKGRAQLWLDVTQQELARIAPITEGALAGYSSDGIAECVAAKSSRGMEVGSEVFTRKAREAGVRALSLMLASELDDLEVRACHGSLDAVGNPVEGRALGRVDEAWLDCTTGRIDYLTLEHDGRKIVMPMSELATHVDLEQKRLYVVSPCASNLLAQAPALDQAKEQTLQSEEFRDSVARFYADPPTGGAAAGTRTAKHIRVSGR